MRSTVKSSSSMLVWVLLLFVLSTLLFQDASCYTARFSVRRTPNPLRRQLVGTTTIRSATVNSDDCRRRGKIFRRFRSMASSKGSNNNNNNNDSEKEQEQLLTDTAQSSSVDTKNTDTSDTIPSYKELIIFTATTILIWISEPLLSLVDTAIVGMTSAPKTAVVQIAALGPATTLYDSAIYMTYFLAIAATNQLAPGLAKKDWKGLRKSTSHLMGLGLMFGLLVTAVVFGFGQQLMTKMAGHLTNAEIIPLATNYAMIRAAVAPFCVVDFVAQSFCLTNMDTLTPAIAVAVASIVNIIGDLLLVPRFGIQGAAVATAIATVSSCLILTNKVRKTTRQWKQYIDVEENQAAQTISTVVNGTVVLLPASEANISEDSTKMETSLPDTNNVQSVPQQNNHVPFFSLPDRKSIVDLFKLAGPIFFVMMGKIACYSVMTVRATNFGIVPLASHNIMMRVFFFFSCFGDSLSQAAQTFFPQVKKLEQGRLFRRLFYISAGIGLFISNFSALILSRFGSFLTKDASIISCMAQYAPWVGGAIFLHPFLMVLEGSLLAKRDLVFLTGMYIATIALHFSFVFSPISASFLGLWRAFFVFQAIRLIQLTGRVFERSRNEKVMRNIATATS
jgi:Na+-driven multidrug efflux pump